MVFFLYFWNVGLSQGYHIIRQTSSSRVCCKAKSWGIVAVCWGMQRWGIIYVFHPLFSGLPQWILLGTVRGQSGVCHKAPYSCWVFSSVPRLLFQTFSLLQPDLISFLFLKSPTAHYSWRLRGPFWCRAGWRHSDHHRKSDNWERWLHGAIRSPEDDGR